MGLDIASVASVGCTLMVEILLSCHHPAKSDETTRHWQGRV